jgi:hypothetical protein
MHHEDELDREVHDSDRMIHLDDGESIGQGSIGTQGDSAPHNMSANHRQTEGKLPKFKGRKD